MTKRYVVLSTDGEYDYLKEIEFTNESRTKAINAFRTLYGESRGYILFEQVACSEPAGSCDEADDTSGEASVQSSKHIYTGGSCNDLDDSY